jgi:phosphate transport system protein
MRTLAPRETFDRHLKLVLDEVLVEGSMVEQAILLSMDAMKRKDLQAAKKIIADDRLINLKRYDIENEVLTLMATQQPMARDLRFLAAVLEIITELERIGDYGKGISRIVIMLGEEADILPLNDLQRMAERGLDMLHRALGAFITRDARSASLIPAEDNDVDAMYNQIYHSMIAQVVLNPSLADQANYIIWAAHNLERMADRVTNICERIIFVVTGSMRDFDVSDDEMNQS